MQKFRGETRFIENLGKRRRRKHIGKDIYKDDAILSW